MENKKEIVVKIDRLLVFISGAFLFLFPLAISTLTTDAYVIPKQAILAFVAIVGLGFWGIKAILLENVRIRRTPFDLPVVLFGLAVFLSAVLAVNRSDSLISFVGLLFALIFFFIITNSAKRSQDVLFLCGSLIAGSAVISLITVLSYFKIYLLPFEATKFQTFTTFGSLFDQSLYLIVILSLCAYLALPALKKRATDKTRYIFVVGTMLLLIGTFVTLLSTFTIQKPTILPYQAGFQTAFASISQDNGRVIQGFLSGSGFGTFLTDFTRFKPATINADPNIWSISFLRSSSFVLELIATTGLLGIMAFIFLAFKIVRTKPVFLPLIILLIMSILVPFSYLLLVLFFIILAIYSASQGLEEKQKTKFFDVDLKIVALKRGVFALSAPGRSDSENGNILPILFLLTCGGLALLLGVLSGKFLLSDYKFQQSIVAANSNNAQKTYQLQSEAIKLFPQRDGYHRIFSQINLSLANNLASSVPQGSSPSAQTQQTIYQLIQQSISSGRNATTISPQTSSNWQNLSSIYRSLIGFGQNADNFAVVANQQALQLDPNNPQQYINYGGIFYQLGQWDNAIRQFQIAISLKPDFANAYYNLGHALEQKGDLQNALISYQRVRALSASNKESVKQIDLEIKALEEKIGKVASGEIKVDGSAVNQPELEVDKPSAQLPKQNPEVKIPGPTSTPSPTPTPKPSSITPTPEL